MRRPRFKLLLPLFTSLGRAVAACALLFAFGISELSAQSSSPIPDGEALLPPTTARLASITQAAQQEGWAAQRAGLQTAALRAYESNKLSAAEAWYNVLHWAVLFAQTETEYSPGWAQRVNEAKVAHANLPPYRLSPKTLGSALAPELQGWLVGNAAFSAEFFSLLSPLDFVPGVFQVLDELYRADAAKFKAYPNLALALAVVYDVPPPPFWPHAQVPEKALPRKLPAAKDAFAWWIKQDQAGRTYQKINRLSAEDLKFVVDAAAPFTELEWSQQTVLLPLVQLPTAYSMIKYNTARLDAGIAVWPGPTYRLADILAAGGICAEQAYFATEIGKARGVPTLFFHGAGNDGRHAWFGFLDGTGKWQLDAGRYAEQRFVTGYALDPQTWAELSDHDLQFLTDRFHSLPAYRQSRVHAAFAGEYLGAGKVPQAIAAARKAVNFERRNQDGWEILVAATQAKDRDPRAAEAVLREAALAFQKYPDLEAFYVNRVAASLRARGEASAAEAEIRRIANKNQADRSDLAAQQARNLLTHAIEAQPLPERIRIYNQLVDTAGQGGGIGFFDEVVTVFVEHLVQVQQPAEAARALDRARHSLRVESHSQLEAEFDALAKTVKSAK